MKTKAINFLFYKLIFFFIYIIISINCYGQDQPSRIPFKNKIGIGGFTFNQKEYLLTLSYTRILAKRNELAFPIYYITDGYRKGISLSILFNWATINRNSRFNFYISPQINLDYSWHPKYNSDLFVKRYGYFFCLGLIPSLRITNRICISLELVVGYGYLWAKNDGNAYNYIVYNIESGSYFRTLPALRLSYKFNKN
jgi:hypothetical protein